MLICHLARRRFRQSRRQKSRWQNIDRHEYRAGASEGMARRRKMNACQDAVIVKSSRRLISRETVTAPPNGQAPDAASFFFSPA